MHGLAGQLGASIYGRCCDVAVITDSSAVTAVNAVLSQLCNLVRSGKRWCASSGVCLCLLRREYCGCIAKSPPGTLASGCEHGAQASTVIVSSRPAAQRVVEHYASKRMGLVQCKIVDEMRSRFSAVSAKLSTQQWAIVSLSCVLCTVCTIMIVFGWCVCMQADASAASENAAACGLHRQQDGRRPCAEAAAGNAGLMGAGGRSQGYRLLGGHACGSSWLLPQLTTRHAAYRQADQHCS